MQRTMALCSFIFGLKHRNPGDIREGSESNIGNGTNYSKINTAESEREISGPTGRLDTSGEGQA